MNLECQLFVPGTDGKDTRAMYFCMDKATKRTQARTSKDNLDPPFTKYAMLRAQNEGYVRLEIRRFQGENDGLFPVDLIDDEEPYTTLELTFKTFPKVSAGSNTKKDSNPTLCGSSSRPAGRTQPNSPQSESDSGDDSDSTTSNSLQELQEALKAAEKEEKEAMAAVKAKLASTRKRTDLLKKLL
ncbi:hypothetical protein B0H12DRAFT_596577 [Mycena haematopus]|nr:hypothetical protein B0H12DRAFT_596577 [Mycena haematopus]